MSTKREQIISYLKTSLGTISGAPIFRSRAEAIAREITPAITIEPGKDVPSNTVHTQTDWSFLVNITVITRGAIPDQLADTFIQTIHERIMSDQSLGGLAMDIEPAGYNPEIFDGDKPIGIFENLFRVSYRTTELNLTQ